MKTKIDKLCYWKWRKKQKQYLEERVDFIICGVYSDNYTCDGFNIKCGYYRPVSIKDKLQAIKDKIKAKSKK
jgi:hypothetical protein